MSARGHAPGQALPDVNPAKRETLIAPSPHEKVGRLTLHQLGILQWIATLLAPIVWFSQHLFGYGLGEAVCRAGAGWGVGYDVYQLTAMSIAGLLVVTSWLCGLVVFRHLKGADYGDGPPERFRWGAQHPYGRLQFFAAASLVANFLFLTAMILDGTASALDTYCAQSLPWL